VLGQKVSSPSGGYYASLNCQVDWTLGEIAIQTYDNGPNILTAGFHQPSLLVMKTPDERISSSIVSVYPNPATDKITISRISDLHSDAKVKIFDAFGRLISFNNLSADESTISLATLPAGIYTLKVIINDTENHQFKIIKTLK
jgi:hypothetical protein